MRNSKGNTGKSNKESFNKDHEMKIYGVNAALAIFKKRPNDIIRVYLSQNQSKVFNELTRFCSLNKKAFHFVDIQELEKVSSSTHHEGICLLIKRKPLLTLKELKITNSMLILALENVGNPHNIGAIMRTAAHFGVNALILPDAKLAQSAAAIRTAEGGAESLPLISAPNLKETLMKLKSNGFDLLATSSHANADLFKFKFNPKTVIILGEERFGVSKEIIKLCENTINISGTGNVESLNVASASSILLSQYWQQLSGHFH